VKITENELHYIAQGSEMGMSFAEITASVSCSESQVRRIIDQDGENLPERQKAIWDAHLQQARKQTHGAKIRHAVEIAVMVPDAYETIHTLVKTSDSKDPRLAFEASKYVLANAGMPVYSEKLSGFPGTQVNTQVNFYQNEKTANAVETAIGSIAEMSLELAGKPLPAINEPDQHTRVSEPATTTQIKAVSLEKPTEKEEVLVSATHKSVEGMPAHIEDSKERTG